MKLEIHVHIHNLQSEVAPYWAVAMQKTLEKIMNQQDNAAEVLEQTSAKLDKITGEVGALKDQIAELEAAAGESGNVSARLQAAVDAVVSRADAIDLLNEDAPE